MFLSDVAVHLILNEQLKGCSFVISLNATARLLQQLVI